MKRLTVNAGFTLDAEALRSAASFLELCGWYPAEDAAWSSSVCSNAWSVPQINMSSTDNLL